MQSTGTEMGTWPGPWLAESGFIWSLHSHLDVHQELGVFPLHRDSCLPESLILHNSYGISKARHANYQKTTIIRARMLAARWLLNNKPSLPITKARARRNCCYKFCRVLRYKETQPSLNTTQNKRYRVGLEDWLPNLQCSHFKTEKPPLASTNSSWSSIPDAVDTGSVKHHHHP